MKIWMQSSIKQNFDFALFSIAPRYSSMWSGTRVHQLTCWRIEWKCLFILFQSDSPSRVYFTLLQVNRIVGVFDTRWFAGASPLHWATKSSQILSISITKQRNRQKSCFFRALETSFSAGIQSPRLMSPQSKQSGFSFFRYGYIE